MRAFAMSANLSRQKFSSWHEQELRWRWSYAEGEVMGIGSSWRTEYVPVYRTPSVDLRCIAAAHRMRRIDKALARISALHRHSLRIAYGERNVLAVFGPAGNLVPFVASPWHVRSRSKRPLPAWLRRIATQQNPDQRVVRELSYAADALLEEATEAYARQAI